MGGNSRLGNSRLAGASKLSGISGVSRDYNRVSSMHKGSSFPRASSLRVSSSLSKTLSKISSSFMYDDSVSALSIDTEKIEQMKMSDIDDLIKAFIALKVELK